jgi:hypothetical protein
MRTFIGPKGTGLSKATVRSLISVPVTISVFPISLLHCGSLIQDVEYFLRDLTRANQVKRVVVGEFNDFSDELFYLFSGFRAHRFSLASNFLAIAVITEVSCPQGVPASTLRKPNINARTSQRHSWENLNDGVRPASALEP